MSNQLSILAHSLFSYDSESGILTSKVNSTRRSIGEPVGFCNKMRRVIYFNKKAEFAYRIIWLMHNGKWPDGVIDHINGNPSDDRIENLRDVSVRTNLENQTRPAKRNTTGFLGVTKTRNRRRFMATIFVNQKQIYLGTYDDPELAHEAYVKAKRIYHKGCTI